MFFRRCDKLPITLSIVDRWRLLKNMQKRQNCEFCSLLILGAPVKTNIAHVGL